MRDAPYKTYKFADGSQLEIHHESDPDSPRNWDNLGTIVGFHKRYQFGDKHDYRADDYSGYDEIQEAIEKNNPGCVILPIFMYDHSGVTINTTGFSCPWDSGQVGFIFVSREKINEEFGGHGGRTDEQIEVQLRGEIETYDQYLRGDIFGFILRKPPCTKCGGPGEESDSCWGFYGDVPIENGMSDHFDEKIREELETADLD